MTVRQHWAGLAQGMQQDLQAYGQLRDLLHTQFHAALRHDAPAMEQVALQITAQVQELDRTRQERSVHARALLPAGTPLSMASVFALVQAPLRSQLESMWAQLEAQVQTCQHLNQRNCQLIMEQAEVMRTVIAGSAQPDIYAPI